LKKTTEVMHAEIGKAVCELRRRLEWSQEQLAEALSKARQPTHPLTVSRWERGVEAPCPEKRSSLAKIATKAGHEDLAALFRAPMVAWQLAGYLARREAK
jgi:transcriptional regulator with XRE-family HTH domain